MSELIPSVLSIIAIIVSVVVARGTWRLDSRLASETKTLQEKIHAETKSLQERVHSEAKDLEKRVHGESLAYAKRQQLVSLFAIISELTDIDPKNPIPQDIIKSLNAMELLAACRHYGVVEAELLDLVLMSNYLHICGRIEGVEYVEIPRAGRKTGKQLIESLPLVYTVYQEYKRKHDESLTLGSAAPLGKLE